MMRLSLRQLECFVAAADAGSIAGGAAACQGSQSAVSLAVSELEKRLGVQLLIRQQAKGVFLTDAGRHVLADARAVIAHATDLMSAAQADGSEVAGDLTIGCYTTLAPFFIPPLLDEFTAHHPKVSLSIIDGSQDDLHNLLLSGRAEVALLYDRGLGPNLKFTVIRRCRPYLLLAADHPLAKKKRIRLSEIADEPLIALDVPPSLQNSERVLRDAGYEPNVRYRTSNIEMVRCLVARGLGYATLVQPWPNDVSYEGRPLASRQIVDDVTEHRVVVAQAEGAQLTRRAALLVSYCIERLGLPT